MTQKGEAAMIQYYYLSAMSGSVVEKDGVSYFADRFERQLSLRDGVWWGQLSREGISTLEWLPLTTEQILITHVDVVAWLAPASAELSTAIVLHPDGSVREMSVSRLRWVKVAP